jgi:hypothetical protein
MKEALQVINEMQKAGVIGKYAIGGAVGAIYYLEPLDTFDLDIFASFQATPGSLIVSPKPIYDYLKARGYEPQNEHVVIAGSNVQFLPADFGLESEALAGAVRTEYDGVETWVMTAEHLMALALKTGRAKDMVRITQFMEKEVYDEALLQHILAHNNLIDKWKNFHEKYGGSK